MIRTGRVDKAEVKVACKVPKTSTPDHKST